MLVRHRGRGKVSDNSGIADPRLQVMTCRVYALHGYTQRELLERESEIIPAKQNILIKATSPRKDLLLQFRGSLPLFLYGPMIRRLNVNHRRQCRPCIPMHP